MNYHSLKKSEKIILVVATVLLLILLVAGMFLINGIKGETNTQVFMSYFFYVLVAMLLFWILIIVYLIMQFYKTILYKETNLYGRSITLNQENKQRKNDQNVQKSIWDKEIISDKVINNIKYFIGIVTNIFIFGVACIMTWGILKVMIGWYFPAI